MSFLSLLFNTILYQILVNSSMYEAGWKEVYMNNNNLISCQDLADIRYFLSKLASEHCTDIEHIDNLTCKLTSLQVNLQYNHPLLIKDNSILID